MDHTVDDRTRTPLTWMAVAIATTVSVTFYISRVEGQADLAKDEAVSVRADMDETRKAMTLYMQSIDQRLSRMEGAMQRNNRR